MADAQTAQARELSVGRGAGLVCVVALIATALMAAPVVLKPSERVFGSGQILSRDDPNRDVLVVIDQFRTGRVPAPYLQPLTDLPGRILARFIGAVPAYNLLVLISFPLAATAAYLLARYVFASHLAAVVAGLAYAFLPFHVMQAGGHPHIAQTQWLPLYLLALWACIDRPSLSRALFLLLTGAAAGLADFYAGFIIAVLSPAALFLYGWLGAPPSTESRSRRVGTVSVVLMAGVLVGLGALRIFVPDVAAHPATSAFPRSELFDWSARWWSYLIPAVDHPFWGSMVREFWSGRGVGVTLLEHQQVSLGIALVVLALVPLWGFWRGVRDTPLTRSAPVLAILATVALLCSLSPEREIGGVTLSRPSAALYEIAPMFRAYARFGGVVGLMTSLLAGAGAAMLWHRDRRGKATAALLLGLAAVEFAPFPPWRSRDLLPTAAHRFLRSQPGPMRVLDCVDPTRLSDTLIAPILGHEISTLGVSGFDDCGEPRLGEKLTARGYSHVIVRRETPTGSWLARDPTRFARRSSLTPGTGFKDAWILSVNAGRPGIHAATWSGFYPREYGADRTWRWMAQNGAIRFATPGAHGTTTLEIELRSFPATRRVAWSVNGKGLGEIEVSPEWRRYELRLGPLGQGEFTLAFAGSEPAVVARDVLMNLDARALAVAVSDWTFKDAGVR